MDAPAKNKRRRLSIGNILLLILLLMAIGAASLWSFGKLAQPQWHDLKNYKPQELGNQKPTLAFWNASLPAEPINFLLLGAAGEGNDAPDLTDTILVARIEPTKQKIYLFSLPRDLWIKISAGGNFAKLNALYSLNKKNTGREFDLIKQKAQDITGLTIDHYLFVNLIAVKETVDILGGVNVLVKEDILDTSYPGPNHSYQTFQIKAGWRYLNGETALKYIRSRHSPGGDFDRIARQQEILQALKQKVIKLNFWQIGTFYDIYNALSANVKTDLNLLTINSLWDEFRGLPGENLIKTELTDLLTTGPINLGGENVSVVRPKAGVENYDKIREYIAKTINN